MAMTAVQKQCLLAALGHYPYGQIDGSWGPRSAAATREFQTAHGLTPDGSFGPETETRIREVIGRDETPASQPTPASFWDGIRYWNREEFRCRCGGKYCTGFPAEPEETLVQLAEDVRSHFGRPAHPSSGLRCTVHNANEGGVANSRHLSGKALDFRVEGVDGDTLLAFVKGDPRTRYAYRIGRTAYVHMDVN